MSGSDAPIFMRDQVGQLARLINAIEGAKERRYWVSTNPSDVGVLIYFSNLL